MTFSERDFRSALGLFPTGIVIVTTVTGAGERLGLTVSSFNSVSLSPPLVLFSIARSAYSIAAWMAAEHYTVNILNETQQEISTRFARPLGDKWSGLTPGAGERGAPLLPNALAALECVPHAQHDGGDHIIMVGRVTGIRRRDTAPNAPLVFHGGRYRRLEPEHGMPHPAGDPLWLHGW